MSQSFSDSDYFELLDTQANSGGINPGARIGSENFRLLEFAVRSKLSGSWELCPPFTVHIIQDLYTVSTCGSDGYEAPTGELRISAPLTDDEILPAFRFVLLDPALNPLDLTGWTVTFDVAHASGGHAWSVATTATGTLGEVETTLIDETVPAGIYMARFTLVKDDNRLSVPTWPLELHVEGF
jgi:hypothetical protein